MDRNRPALMPDISHWQGPHSSDDFRLASKHSVGIMFKATESTTFVDPEFFDNVSAAQRADYAWGAYVFVRQGNGLIQARRLVEVVRHANSVFVRSFPHREHRRARFACVDWESGDRQTAQTIVTALQREFKMPVVEYAGAWARSHGGLSGHTDGSIVPHYGPASLPPEDSPGFRPDAWQYTDGVVNGTQMPQSIPGIGSCDVSVLFNPKVFRMGEA